MPRRSRGLLPMLPALPVMAWVLVFLFVPIGIIEVSQPRPNKESNNYIVGV